MHPAILLLIVLLLIVLACLIAVKFFGAKFGGMFDPNTPENELTYGMLNQGFDISKICADAIKKGDLLTDNPFYYMYMNNYDDFERSDFNKIYIKNINNIFNGYTIKEDSSISDINAVNRIGFTQLLFKFEEYNKDKFLNYINAVVTCVQNIKYFEDVPLIENRNSIMGSLSVDSSTSRIPITYDIMILKHVMEPRNISAKTLMQISYSLRRYIENTSVVDSSNNPVPVLDKNYIKLEYYSM